ncbi:MAG: hypothetical protein A2Z20_00435 [Bdellovibrionales bacterium RBG_16_40_8]|nr:MAG: hypothetical protein A2Z20_00435 [Bdellovibrionales bacterium RBG_16_40_8]
MINDKPVLFAEEQAGEFGLGVIQLNRAKALNSLNLECYKLIEPKLHAWAKNPKIAAIIIESTSEKAFCAGGDVKALALVEQYRRLDVTKEFFTHEYFVDYLIHIYLKPIIAFAEGIAMGGGLGLMNGASHRIVSEKTVLAMPEIAIGFFADVGATNFLYRCPDGFGLFMGLTGARISGRDAVKVGLADFLIDKKIDEKLKHQIRADLLRLSWRENAATNRALITEYFLKNLASQNIQAENFAAYEEVRHIFLQKDYQSLYDQFICYEPKSDFIRDAKNRFIAGSPTSKQVFFNAYSRHKNKSWSEVFVAEWEMAIRFSKENEFFEGVRAVLIDKDNSPRWNPADEKKVKNIERFFACGEANMLAEKIRIFQG